MSTRLALLVSTMALGCLLPLNAQTADIVINASQVLGPVNRLVFGQNIVAADSARIFSSDTTDMNLIQRGDGFWDSDTGTPAAEVVAQSKAVGTSVLRYPGGCYAHNFDWRKTVGPDAKKNGWLFGLNEYLSLCGALGAIPLITVSDYALPADQMPENAAELVEYLNSPADAAHPWAMKRKEYGHSAPYKVVWFELGNESMHGNHRVLPYRQYTAEQYSAYANATASAMRKVDPGIRIGIVMVPGSGTDVDCDWNHTVVHLAGANANFVVIHMYAPEKLPAEIPANLRMQAMMVAPQHVEERLTQYHQMIRQQLGHDLPLAITEFNGALDQATYRFSFGDALECADLLRVFLKPELNVALASYWNFLNGAFGMLRTTERSSNGEPITEEPVLLLYKLWAQHFGSQLLKVDVRAPQAEFPGVGSEEAATGSTSTARRQIQVVDLNEYSPALGVLWPKLLNVQIQRQNSNFTIHLQNLTRSIYPGLARIPRPSILAPTPVEFSVSFDAKFVPDPGSDTAPMGIGLMDTRGWSATHSGIGVDGITTNLKHFDATYRLNPQTPGVDLQARLVADGKNVSGTLQVQNLRVASFVAAHDAAYPLLTSSASVSSDGAKLYVIVFNKSASTLIQAAVRLVAFPAAKAQYWELDGPGLDATALTQTPRGAMLPLNTPSTLTHAFPPHSMTAIEFISSR